MEIAEPRSLTYEMVVSRVYEDAHRVVGETVSEEQLQDTVDQVVSSLWSDSTRVTSFIPVLALREITQRLADKR